MGTTTIARLAVKILLGMALLAPSTVRAGDDETEPRIIIQKVNPWTNLDLNNDPANFQFAIVTDRTGGHRPGVFPEGVAKLNLLQPEFVMSVGDLIEGYTEDQEQLDAEGFVEALEMPFFYLPGNHDYSNEVMAEDWAQRFGASYYHFVYRDVLFLCLNSEEAGRALTQEQVDYARWVLDENSDVRWTLVFLHQPLWVYEDRDASGDAGTLWPQVEDGLKGRRHTVFAGHFHSYTLHERNNADYFVLATTGGGSGLRGPLFGQFDHVVWVTMTDAGPRIANLMLKGIWDKEIRTKEVADLLDGVLRGTFLAISPIFTEQEVFAGGSTKLRLTNDADVPLSISASFADDAVMSVSPESIERVLPPNSVELIDVEVTAAQPVRVRQFKPLVMEWKAKLDHPELKIPEFEGTASLMVAKEFDVDVRTGPVVVDGDLGEWADLPFVVDEPAQIDVDPTSWTGSADCSWRFGVELSDEYLYIALEVTDERPIYTGAAAWQQDGVEVRVDGRADPERSDNRGNTEQRGTLFVSLSPAHDVKDLLIRDPEFLDSLGVEAICVDTEKGHNTEIAIPVAFFEERQGKEWSKFRLNIAIDDFDELTGPLAQLWWQPDWRDATNYPGSGTFRRRWVKAMK